MRIHLVLEIICTLPHSRYLYNMLEAGRNPHTMKSEKQRDSNRLGTTYKDQGMQPAFFKQKQRRERGMDVASNKRSFGFLSGEREEEGRPQLFVLGSIK